MFLTKSFNAECKRTIIFIAILPNITYTIKWGIIGFAMVKEIEELIKIVGKGNLLEAAFIYLGSFQHADLGRRVDRRNHSGLSAFIKKEREPLDEYFNLKFSLQGLFLIYAQAYKILAENAQLNTQEVIDKIYEIIKRSELGKDINEVLNGRKLDLLNILANPKREPIFKTEEDFENKVLIGVRELLSEENALNEYDREFALNKCIIDFYYSIHQGIKVDRDVALLFSIGSHYKKLSPSNKTVRREVLEIDENQLIESYIRLLAGKLHMIGLSSRDKYTINHENVDRQEKGLKEYGGFRLCPINTKNTLERLLKNQDSDEFEQLVTSPGNIYYLVQQEENECRPSFIFSKKKDHKNTVCKLILGMFVLSVGLYVADYFLMEQKLLNSMKNILPQDNLTNLVIVAVLTIITVYALFQLLKQPQEPPHSAVNDTTIKDFTNDPMQSSR